jgi:hypothetical protein
MDAYAQNETIDTLWEKGPARTLGHTALDYLIGGAQVALAGGIVYIASKHYKDLKEMGPVPTTLAAGAAATLLTNGVARIMNYQPVDIVPLYG